MLKIRSAAERLCEATLSDGVLLGSIKQSIAVFKGVPYAQPPTGSRRWKPAEAAPAWEGDRLALAFGPAPMQPAYKDRHSFFYKPAYQSSEDCSYLNIWAPCDSDIETNSYRSPPRPVMVWLYGGGLLVGSASDPFYDATELARKGVVVVSINYRLGVFSNFAHPALSAESPYQVSGNYGTSDQIQALKWLQKNIAAFNGDPNNITVFGQSAGGLSVSHLLASPLAKGLFHRAIIQSGYMPAMPALKTPHLNLMPAEQYGKKMAKRLGISGEQAIDLRQLRDLPADVLLSASDAFEFDKAIVDGRYFPSQVYKAFEQGRVQQLPLLIGFNSNEGSYFPRIGMIKAADSARAYREHIQQRYPDLADDYLRVYPANDALCSAYRSVGDGLYVWGSERIARLMAKSGARVFLYCFDHATAWAEQMGVGAVHTLDVMFSFNNVKHNRKFSPNWPDTQAREIDLNMAETLSDYWVAFARHGHPSSDSLPQWPAYRRDDQRHMVFSGGVAKTATGLKMDVLDLHEKMVKSRRQTGQNWTYKNIGYLAPVAAKKVEEL